MQERTSAGPELSAQQLSLEQYRDNAYNRCIGVLGDETEAKTIEFDSSLSHTDASNQIEMTYGYEDTLFTPQTIRGLDAACIKLSTALKYIAVVFDRAQHAVGEDKVHPVMLNLNSVTIPPGEVTPYEVQFERTEEHLTEAVERGLGAGKKILFDTLVEDARQEEIHKFTQTPTVQKDLTVQTRVAGVYWSVEKLPEGVCSWLLVLPKNTLGQEMLPD